MHRSVATLDSPEFINLQPLDINPLMSKCDIKVFYLGGNRNHTYITKDVAIDIGKNLRGAPIVGYYKQSKEDYSDHGDKITIDDEGIHFECMTVPYGFVSPDAQVWFQNFQDYDDNGNSVTRTYLMTTGYLWTHQFPESSLPVNEGRPSSMEFNKETVKGNWQGNYQNSGMDFFIIDDAVIQKICILGDDVEPCFQGASVTAPNISSKFTLDDNFKRTLFSMMQDLKYALNEGGQQMENLDTTFDGGVGEVGSVSEPSGGDSEVVNDVNTSVATSYVRKKNEDDQERKRNGNGGGGNQSNGSQQQRQQDDNQQNQQNGNNGNRQSQQQSNSNDNSDDEEDNRNRNRNSGNSNNSNSNSNNNQDNENGSNRNSNSRSGNSSNSNSDSRSSDSNSDEEDEEERRRRRNRATNRSNYELLEDELGELKRSYSALKKQFDELAAFKNSIDNQKKDELINEFYMLSDEDKRDVICNKEKYTLDEIKAKLAVICYDKKVNFNLNENSAKANDPSVTYTLNDNATDNSLPDWVKAVKEQEKLN